MADSVVGFLLENLSQLLAHEANLLSGVDDKITALHNELKIINLLLKNSEGKKSKNNEIVQEIMNQIRDVAHEAEDVIDTFVSNVSKHRRRSIPGRIVHGIDHAKMLHDVAEKIEKIKITINEIHDNKNRYEILMAEDSSAGGSSSDRQDGRVDGAEADQLRLHKRRREVEEEDVVGFVHDSTVVINQLMEGGSRRSTVSIIGMGGLGKTTLARRVYNNNQVKNHFNCRAWVYVSNDYRARETLLSLLKSLMPISQNKYSNNYGCSGSNRKKSSTRKAQAQDHVLSLTEDELKNMVRECLKNKRYLVVLDDIWRIEDWDELQDTFPDDKKGSRVLITSRLREVASYTNSHTPPYQLPFLNDEESWELFSKKVFQGRQHCPSDLEPLGRQIVQSCKGLPLSIVVLAGLLSHRTMSQREWYKIMGHVNWYLTQDQTQVKDIVLKLSYDNLPRRLKPCFLYFGVFPEDSEIRVRRLIELWVAEGFIQQTGTRIPEDVAEDYLHELIDRSLIQVGSRKSDGGVKTCRIHDLLRDLCISQSEQDNFFQVRSENNILTRSKPRRLSIHCSIPHYVSSSKSDHSCVRSLFCLDQEFYIVNWKWLLEGFKLVRVLDLGQGCLSKLKISNKVEALIHLRYLRIDTQFVRGIPASICNLWNLETLDVGPPKLNILISFPTGMWKLKRLRHLRTVGPLILPNLSKLDDTKIMWNLQTLSSVALNSQAASMMEKGIFPMLRSLELYMTPDHKYSKPCELLRGLKHLRHLNKLTFLSFPELPICANAFPCNIINLKLVNMKCLNIDAMSALGNLPKLQILKILGLVYPNSSVELNCVTGGFPQLQVFEMGYLRVHNWKLAKGGMPCLQRMVINRCRELASLPDELWSLTTLQEVRVLRPSKACALMLQNLQMSDRCKLIIYPTDAN